MARIRNFAAVKTADQLLDSDVIAGDPQAGSTFQTSLAQLKDYIPGDSFENLINNTGNTTLVIPARKRRHHAEIAVGGVAAGGARLVVLPTAFRVAGDCVEVGIDLPATPGIVLEFRNGTSLGDKVAPDIVSTGTVERARLHFIYTGTAWKKDMVIYPA